MPSLDDLNSALLQADAAGDTTSAQLFAQQIKAMRAATPAPPVTPSPTTAPTGIMNHVGAMIEPWLAAGSAAAAMPIAGWAGILSGGDPDAVAKTQAALTYQPRTQGGQQGLAGLGNAASAVGSALATPVQAGALGDVNPISRYIGDSGALADAGQPGLATLHAVLPQALGLLAGGGMQPVSNVLTGLPTALAQAPGAIMDAGDAAAAALRAKAGVNPMPVFPTAADVPPMTPPVSVPSALPPQIQAAVAATPAAKVNPVVLARHTEASTLPVPMTLSAGQATQDPYLISNEMNMRAGNQVAANMKKQNDQLIQNVNAIRDQVAPDAPSDALTLGQQQVDAYKALDTQTKADINDKYQALIDANGGDLPIDGQTFVSNATQALKQNLKLNHLAPSIAADLDTFADGTTPMTFADFENMRTNLAAEARKGGNAAAAANIVRQQLEELPLTDETAELKPLADDARAAARTRFQTIEGDPAYKAAINDGVDQGEPSPLADKFMTKYVATAPTANVQTMLANLSDDPTAQQNVAAALVDHLKTQAGVNPLSNTGNFTQAGYNRALATTVNPKLDLAMDEQSAAQTRALGNVARYTQFQPRGSFVNNSNTTVSAMAPGMAANAAEAALNAKTGIGGTLLRKMLEGRAANAAAAKAMAPAAGLDYVSPTE